MTRSIFIAAALALAATLPAIPAQAQAARTFVSAAGSDSNNCINVATPCRHFAAAYAATATNGEIDVLDPANYGQLTISHGISVQGHGWASVSAVSGGAAITINGGNNINISGVILDGGGTVNSTGIQFNSGGYLTICDSVIRNFTNDGIAFSSFGILSVSNTRVSDNGLHGIEMGIAMLGLETGFFDHVHMENNGGYGLFVHNPGGQQVSSQITVTDSVSANNGDTGLGISSSAGPTEPPTTMMVRNSTIYNNGNVGLAASGAATIRVTRSTITANYTGWSGNVLSYADNNIDGDLTVDTTPTQIGYR